MLGHVTGEGQLNENTVDGRVIVGLGDLLDQLQLGARFGDIDQSADNVGLGTVRQLLMHVIWFRRGYLLSSLQLHAHIGA
jgi:hypothetical protein